SGASASASGTTTGGGASDTDTSASASDTDTSTGDSASSSSSGGGAGVCGDGGAEGDEACDGADLGGKTCGDLGFQYGALGCAADCTADASKCTDSAACGDGIVVPGVLCYLPFAEINKYNHFNAHALADLNEDGHLDFIAV